MNAFAWFDPSFSMRFTVTLLHFLWQGVAVALVVFFTGWWLRRSTASMRYAINVAAMIVLAACLPVTFACVEVPQAETIDTSTAAGLGASSNSEHHLVTTSVERAVAAGEPGAIVPALHNVRTAAAGETREAAAFFVDNSAALAWLRPIADSVMAGYFVGLVGMIVRLVIALRGSERLRGTAKHVEHGELLEMVRRRAARLGLKAAPLVGYCKEISIPVAMGIVKPMILLPTALTSGLSADQLEALVTHELAHVRRHDLFVNLFQRFVEAVLFFHPAVWFVSHRISLERENAADDMVLEAGWPPANYADALVRMAELSSSLRGANVTAQAATIAASGPSGSDFKRRILRLLGHNATSNPKLTRSGLVTMALAAISLFVAPMMIQTTARNAVGQVNDGTKAKAQDSDAKPTGDGDDTEAAKIREAFDELVAAKHWRERSAAAKKLGEFGRPALPTLLEGTKHANDKVRDSSYRVLWEKFTKEPSAVDAFLRGLEDDNSRICYSCAFRLGYHKIEQAVEPLRAIYKNSEDLQLTAAKSLAELGHTDGFLTLYDQLGGDFYMQRYQANLGIKALTGKDLNDFADYDWSEGAFVSGGREMRRVGRSAEEAENKSKRFRAIAEFHRWLIAEKPKLAALLDPSLARIGSREDQATAKKDADAESDSRPKDKDSISWGKPVDGLEIGLTSSRSKPLGNTVPELLAFFRNSGEERVFVVRSSTFFVLELNGRFFGGHSPNGKSSPLTPGERLGAVKIEPGELRELPKLTLGQRPADDAARPRLQPGRNTLRVIYWHDGEPVRSGNIQLDVKRTDDPGAAKIPVRVRSRHFLEGDSITIDALIERDSASDGGRYEVRGRYRLESRSEAELAQWCAGGHVGGNKSIKIKKGEGEFRLTFSVFKHGAFHLSMYPVVDPVAFRYRLRDLNNPHQALLDLSSFGSLYYQPDGRSLRLDPPPKKADPDNRSKANSPRPSSVAWSTQAGEFYRLHFSKDLRKDAEQVRGYLDKCVQNLEVEFGREVVRPLLSSASIDVCLQPQPTEEAGEGQALLRTSSNDGVYNAEIQMLTPSAHRSGATSSVGEPMDEHYIFRNLVHEYSTIVLDRLTQEKPRGWRFFSAPSWFVQGYEEYLGLMLSSERNHRITAQKYRSLARSDPSRVTAEFEAKSPYIDGAMLLWFLHDTYGKEQIHALLRSDAPDFWSAVEEVLSKDKKALHEAWRVWLASG